MEEALRKFKMKSDMLLSIVIPCYNSARFITATLDMLVEQELQDCEIIVVNDGSTDSTAEFVERYTHTYPNITLINKCNEGVSVARNTGITAANGKYIYFLDSDDTLTPETLSFFRATIERYQHTDMFAFGYESHKGRKVLKKYIYKKYNKKDFSAQEIQKAFLTKKICTHICSSLYRKEFLINNELYFTPGVRIGEDIEFILKALSAVSGVHYESRCCFIYQIRNDSTMQGYRTYSNERFDYFISRNQLLTRLFYESLPTESSFFILNLYLSHLVSFLRSDCNDKNVSEKFINYSYLVNTKSVFSVKVFILQFLVKIIGVKQVLKIFNKIK